MHEDGLEQIAGEVAKSPHQGADNQQVKTPQAIFPDIFIKAARALKGAALDVFCKVTIEVVLVVTAAYF